jgi:hypothetical protein
MIIPLTILNNGSKVHAVSDTGKTVCGQLLDKELDSCGLTVHVTCIGCQKKLINAGMLDQRSYLFHKKLV